MRGVSSDMLCPELNFYPCSSFILRAFLMFIPMPFLLLALVCPPDVSVALLLVVSDSARFASNKTCNPGWHPALLRGEQQTTMEMERTSDTSS
ncbi:hypothetical protein V8C42DRAFT_256427 [Trichoderma barbatum]